MGLDMYLYKRTYVKNWNPMSSSETHKITVKKGGKVHPCIKPERISFIVEEIAYWRKFNALHSWFVNNVQGGEDECQDSYLTFNKLKELCELLKLVKANEGNLEFAENNFPTEEGFFFGSTDYSEYYFEQVKTTIDILEQIIEEGCTDSDYYYSSSW